MFSCSYQNLVLYLTVDDCMNHSLVKKLIVPPSYWVRNFVYVNIKMNSFAKFGLYKDLGEILQDLSKHENLHPVQQLLKIYEEAKTSAAEGIKQPNFPLIVLEGLDGAGKTAMSKKLSKKFEGVRCVTPPESIRSLREYFDNNSDLRTAYYSLGNYIAALEVSCILREKPVIMDRFWHSTSAYALAQKVADHPDRFELPDPTDEIYQWPLDLLKPEKVILLTVSEDIRLERHSRRSADLVTKQEHLLKADKKFRENIIQAFQNMRDPNVSIINSDGSFGYTFYILMDSVKPLLRK